MSLLRGPNRGGELKGLGSPDEIALFIQREKALMVRAQRKEADARVRYSNFQLVQGIVALVLVVAAWIAVVIGAVSNPELLKLALGAGGILGAVGAALHRWGPKQRGNLE
jgi:predicted PurR-regulated permease PerM